MTSSPTAIMAGLTPAEPANTNEKFRIAPRKAMIPVLNSAGFTPLAFANALRIGSSSPVYVAGLLRREPRIAPWSTGTTPPRPDTEPWISGAQSSAHRFLHERAYPCLVGGGQLRQREGDRPHGAFVEVRRVVEAERRVPGLELLRALEEADDLAVLGIRGHPVPGLRREGWGAGFDDRVEPLAQGAIRFRHLGDLREHGAFPVRLVRARAAARGRLLGALLHRGSFLVRESVGLPVGRGGALGGLLRVLLWAHRNLLTPTWLGNLAAVRVRTRATVMRRLTRVSPSSRRPSRSSCSAQSNPPAA